MPWRAPALVALVSALVLGVMVVFGRLTVLEGLGGIAAVALVAGLVIRARANGKTTDIAATDQGHLDPAVERFADTLSEPCMVVNARGVLVYGNLAARDQFPRARPGDPLAFALRDPDFLEAVSAARTEGGPRQCEIHQTVPNETWYRVSAVPYGEADESGAPFVVITLTNLTEQRRTDQMRADFIANASHELRTPLTSLMGFIDTLQGPAAKDAAARTRFLGIMRGQAERMSALVDDLLSLSRIELRQHVKPTTRVVLNTLVREVAESLEARAQDAGARIAFDFPDADIAVTGERAELFEVIENLLDNAIKYGGAGVVDVALTPAASRSGAHHALTVTDHGPGVASEHVPRLTERFYRVDAESSRKKKGTGLGLAIVKHIVNRHHGQLTIRSRPGEGTRVEVLLPATDAGLA